jgi:hypothetical protein
MKMQTKIVLQFDKALTRLAGNEFGKSVFDTQVKDKIDYTQQTEIVFPDQIVAIASSFVQGFFDEIIKNVGILGIGRRVLVVAPSIDVQEKIIKNLQ